MVNVSKEQTESLGSCISSFPVQAALIKISWDFPPAQLNICFIKWGFLCVLSESVKLSVDLHSDLTVY